MLPSLSRCYFLFKDKVIFFNVLQVYLIISDSLFRKLCISLIFSSCGQLGKKNMSTDKITVWEGEWKKGNTSFHLPEVNPKLLNNLDILLGGCEPTSSEKQQQKTVLLPLCGKTRDLVHLHSLGHNVIGCEWIEQACNEFFSENNIEFTKSPLEGVDGSLYTVSGTEMS